MNKTAFPSIRDIPQLANPFTVDAKVYGALNPMTKVPEIAEQNMPSLAGKKALGLALTWGVAALIAKQVARAADSSDEASRKKKIEGMIEGAEPMKGGIPAGVDRKLLEVGQDIPKRASGNSNQLPPQKVNITDKNVPMWAPVVFAAAIAAGIYGGSKVSDHITDRANTEELQDEQTRKQKELDALSAEELRNIYGIPKTAAGESTLLGATKGALNIGSDVLGWLGRGASNVGKGAVDYLNGSNDVPARSGRGVIGAYTVLATAAAGIIAMGTYQHMKSYDENRYKKKAFERLMTSKAGQYPKPAFEANPVTLGLVSDQDAQPAA